MRVQVKDGQEQPVKEGLHTSKWSAHVCTREGRAHVHTREERAHLYTREGRANNSNNNN